MTITDVTIWYKKGIPKSQEAASCKPALNQINLLMKIEWDVITIL